MGVEMDGPERGESRKVSWTGEEVFFGIGGSAMVV
jgi:hypothetical protein